MSGKRSLPSIWASRGALYAAVAAGSLALVTALGAWLMLAPSGDDASTAGRGPVAGSSPGPPSPSGDAGDQATQRTDQSSQAPQAGVGAVPPSAAVERSASAAPSLAAGAPGSSVQGSSDPRSAVAAAGTTPRPGGDGSVPGAGQGGGSPGNPGTSPTPPTPPTSTPPTPTPSTPPTPATPPGAGRGCPTPGKKDGDAGGAPTIPPGQQRSPTDTHPCGPPTDPPPGQAHKPS